MGEGRERRGGGGTIDVLVAGRLGRVVGVPRHGAVVVGHTATAVQYRGNMRRMFYICQF